MLTMPRTPNQTERLYDALWAILVRLGILGYHCRPSIPGLLQATEDFLLYTPYPPPQPSLGDSTSDDKADCLF